MTAGGLSTDDIVKKLYAWTPYQRADIIRNYTSTHRLSLLRTGLGDAMFGERSLPAEIFSYAWRAVEVALNEGYKVPADPYLADGWEYTAEGPQSINSEAFAIEAP